ncbi:hypothetical protein ES702_04210 [subsurface metagenome]
MSIGAKGIDIIHELFEMIGINTSSLVEEVIVSVVIFALSIIIGWVVYHIFERYFTKWAEKTKTNLDDEILKNIKAPVYFFVILIGAYYSLDSLSYLKAYSGFLTAIFTVAQILLVTFIVIRVLNVLVAWYAEKSKKRGKKVSNHILFIFKKIIQAVIVIFALLAVLAAFNVDLTGAVVGLGVGGIAIAFALQNVLSDMFSAFSIYFDRPFEIGDFIIIGSDMGIVKKIGIKSTRIQTLQGEELVVSNNEMVNTRIRNFKKMKKRRIVFHFGVTYGTPSKKLEKIPDMVKKIVNSQELAEIDRVHFTEFGDFSLNFEVVYYMIKGDYVLYRDTQQQINFAIKGAFEKEGIEIAFPTQTIFLNK